VGAGAGTSIIDHLSGFWQVSSERFAGGNCAQIASIAVRLLQ
jgi:hypothetical protein